MSAAPTPGTSQPVLPPFFHAQSGSIANLATPTRSALKPSSSPATGSLGYAQPALGSSTSLLPAGSPLITSSSPSRSALRRSLVSALSLGSMNDLPTVPSLGDSQSDLKLPQYRSVAPVATKILIPNVESDGSIAPNPAVSFAPSNHLGSTGSLDSPHRSPKKQKQEGKETAESPRPARKQRIPEPARSTTAQTENTVEAETVERYKQLLETMELRVKTLENESKSASAHHSSVLAATTARLADAASALRRNESESEQLARENAALLAKLRAAQMDSFSKTLRDGDDDDGGGWVRVSQEEWDEMGRRLKILIAENDGLVAQERKKASEIETMKEWFGRYDDDNANLSAELDAARKRSADLNAQLDSATAQLSAADREAQKLLSELATANSQVERLDTEVKRAQAETRAHQGKVRELRQTLEEVVSRYQAHVEEASGMAERERRLIEAVKMAEVAIEDGKVEVAAAADQKSRLQEEYARLLKVSQSMEQKILEMQEKERDTTKKMEELREQTQEMILERDKALLRDQQAQMEIQKLNDQYTEACAKYRSKAEKEVGEVRAQFAQERRKLNEEIASLESTLAQTQSQMERAIREKRSLENELEKMTQQIPVESQRMSDIIEELSNKLRITEKERIEATELVGSLQQKQQRELNRMEKEKEELVYRIDEAQRRLRRCEKDLEDSKEKEVKQSALITQIEHERSIWLDQKQQILSRYDSEMSSLAQKHVQQTAELSKNLETMTEAHSKASRDLQTLIAKQHDLSLRWKLDTQGLTSHYERQMSDCRAQIAKLQERIIEYEDAVRWEAKGRKEAAGQVEMERRMVEKARAAMRSLEEKCERLLQQNEELVKRGDATLSEKKILERDVDRLKLEIARLERERTKQRSQPPTHRPILRYDDGSSDSETNIKALKAEIERVKNRSRARDSPGIETLLRLREAGHHGRESYGRSRTSSGSSTGGDLSGSS